jgi:hypothetical protein
MHPTGRDDPARWDTPTEATVNLTDLLETLPDFFLPSPERRAGKRLACQVSSDCHPFERQGGPTRWPATVCDLSERGLRLLLGRRFEPGTLLVVEFPEVAGHPGQAHLARVAWVAHHPWEHWILGCAFPRALDRDYFLAVTAEESGEAPEPPEQG